MTRGRSSAFSLVEVVVAIGVFVAGVVGAIAMLSSTTVQSSQTRDVLTAVRAGESTLAWLRSQPKTVIEAAIVSGEEGAYWADRAGNVFSWHEPLDRVEAYFFLVVERIDDVAEVDAAGLALGTRCRLSVHWPMWQAPGERADLVNTDSVAFNLMVRR